MTARISVLAVAAAEAVIAAVIAVAVIAVAAVVVVVVALECYLAIRDSGLGARCQVERLVRSGHRPTLARAARDWRSQSYRTCSSGFRPEGKWAE